MVPSLHGLLARPLSSYYLLLASSGLLLLIGLTMVFSATSVQSYAASGDAYSPVSSQGVYALLGIFAFWFFQRLSADTLRYLGRYMLATSIALLTILDGLRALTSIGVLSAPEVGPIHANLLWLHLGPITIQPAELAKLGMVVWAADVVARKGGTLVYWRELTMPLLPMLGLLFILVGYNDVGTLLVSLALVVGLLWAAGVRLRIFAPLGAVAIAGVGLLIAAASLGAGSGTTSGPNYRLMRLTTFLTPLEKCDLTGPCYQLMQARSAIFEGGWFGVGLGKGTLKWNWLPEADNDFIYAVVAEELGVIGCASILAIFSVLAYTGFRIARRSQAPFRRLTAAAITSWLVTQTVINIGGVVGLVPVTGVPLPFISAGGSALVVSLAAVGILASFARAETDAAKALNARPPAKWARLVWAPLPPPPKRNGQT